MSENAPKQTYVAPIGKTPAGLLKHDCMHPGCGQHGAFGFNKRYGMEWYCSQHKAQGEIGLVPSF